MVLFSGCRDDASSPFGRRPRRHARALICASTSIPQTSRARRTNRRVACPCERPSETRQTGIGLANCAARTRLQSHRLTQVAPFDQSASLEVCAPAAFAGPRCAIRSGQAPDDPASAFAAVRPRPSRTSRADRSNSDIAPAVFRLTNAMRGSSTCGRVACGFADP
jgi:hypothetical protein